MKEENGTLSFATAIDTSGFDEGVANMEAKVSAVTGNIEQESNRMKEALNSIPSVNIDIVTNAAQSLETIDAAFAQIDAVVNENQAGIKALEAEYQRLGQVASQALASGNDKEYSETQKTMDATRQLIAARKEAISEASKMADELVKVEQSLKQEAAAVVDTGGKKKTLRNQIMELTLQLAELEMQGKANTQEFRELQQQAAMLQDQMGDTRTQIQVLANDEAGFAGMLSVMSGVSGGFTALTGAMSLFGSENEDVQKIMVKLQSVMAITMGLQQVAQMLNKDSAASIVVLNGLKQWWHKITLEATGAQTAENAAMAAGTAVATADAAATAANTTATTANAAATAAQTAADTAQAAASTGAAAAEGVQTAATIAETGAATAGTIANWSLAAAFRAVGAAIKSIPVFGWILAGISALIGVVSHFASKASEAKKKNEEWYNSIADKASKPIAKIMELSQEWNELGNNIKEKEAFIRQHAQAFDELGVAIKNVSDAENALSDPQAFIDAQIAKTKAMVFLEKAEEDVKKLIKAEQEYNAMPDMVTHYVQSGTFGGGYSYQAENKAKAEKKKEMDELRETISKGYTDAANAEKEGLKLLENAGISATKTYADGTLGAIEQAIALKQEALKNLTSNAEYEAALKEIQVLQGQANKITGGRSYGGGGGVKFDKAKSALDQKLAAEQFAKEMENFMKDANLKVEQHTISMMAQSQAQELAQINANVKERKQAWEDGLTALAEAKKESEKKIFMSKKGATEVKWYNSEAGKKSVEEYKKDLLKQPEIAAQNQTMLTNIEEQGAKERRELMQRYTDALIDEYGTKAQKLEKLERVWSERMKAIPAEYLPEAMKKMQEEMSALNTEDFKDSIDWDSVFGDLEKQSTHSIAFALERVKEYFEGAKASMSTEDIKHFSEAIKNMEEEIASRSPFSAFGKSIKDITDAKEEFVAAIQEMVEAQRSLTECETEYLNAKAALLELEESYEGGNEGVPLEETTAYIEAKQRLADAEAAHAKATERNIKAENKAMAARNKATSSYKKLSSNIKSIGGVITGLGDNAKNLAGIFSSNVAKGIGKALDVVDSVMNAAGDCIDALADTGKSVSQAMVQTASASGQAMQATATASATAISTVEKASVILTVISAALQVATAIAGLFNGDDEAQERIENLQDEIDQLQWELDNLGAVELEKNLGNAFQNVTEIMAKARAEVWSTQARCQWFWSENAMFAYIARVEADAYNLAVQRIADAYAAVDYTANKLLGSAKWDNSRAQMENYAEQMAKTQQQINAEAGKKDSDQSKIDEWKRQMAEMAEEMAELINGMVEQIIGGSAQDIATQLGDAFFEACENGEDAMEAWGKTAKSIVKDIIKQMLVAKFLEGPIGEIFDKYKKEWFGEDGSFKGIDAVLNTMDEMMAELGEVGEGFGAIYDSIKDKYGEYFANDERDGTSKGIATASQESVDENNARLTTIQAHTYTLVQGVQELNATGNAMLERLTGIENNTQESAESLEKMSSDMRVMRDTLDDIQRKGIKIS